VIRDQWYAVFRSKQLGRRPVGLTRLGRPIVLWRDGEGRARCFLDRCCHRAAALSRGRVADGCLECPYHGLRYDAEGAVVKVPALGKRPLPTLRVESIPVREAHGLIWMWHGRRHHTLPPLPWDDALAAELGTGPHVDFEDEFDVSYLRIMENATDIFHVPFVHRRTMPAGEVLEDFACDVDGVHIRVRGRLTNGEGARGLAVAVHVVAPSLLLLHVSPSARFVALATPIDDANTWLFARYVQDYVRIRLLGTVLAWLLGAFDYVALQRYQDAPIWRSQRLADPGDLRGYRLLDGDRGVAAYFQIRGRLLRQAQDDERRDDREDPASDRLHRGPPDAADLAR